MNLEEILQKYWGYSSFRPMQREIIMSVLEGKDTLALLPTGGGKSICYQIPALAKPGICIVISPLIALMKDQVFQLQKRNIPAVAIYSGMHYRDIDITLDNCVYGKTKLLYLSPERLKTELVRERIKKMNVNLIAVDEAHCVSQWGYDFRPPYLEIPEFRELKPDVPVLAVTATATSEVVIDIQAKLAFKKDAAMFQQSFARDNLAYVVLKEEGKVNKMLDILQKVPGSAIVYARNRRKTKDIARFLQKKGISANFYHAGLDNAMRSARQDAWITNQTRVMVSTNAFGMGIDKPDVRVVVHMDLPESLEAYFQEAGRAARDGKKSYAVLLYNDNDRESLTRQYETSFPEIKEVRQVYRALGSYFQLAVGGGRGDSHDFDLGEFSERFGFNALKVFHCLKILEVGGWMLLTESVFVPAMLTVLVTKEKLYDFEVRNRGFEKLVKTILRTYQGAFTDFVRIDERKLAKFLNLTMDLLRGMLKRMHQEGIIEYKPQREKPQIIFLEERVASENMTIDRELYEFRKGRHWDRIKAAIEYATQPICRSNKLLAYFGEYKSEPCGICDYCLGRTEVVLTEADFNYFKKRIRDILEKQALNLEDLVQYFSSAEENKVLKAIEYLVDNKYLSKEDDLFSWI